VGKLPFYHEKMQIGTFWLEIVRLLKEFCNGCCDGFVRTSLEDYYDTLTEEKQQRLNLNNRPSRSFCSCIMPVIKTTQTFKAEKRECDTTTATSVVKKSKNEACVGNWSIEDVVEYLTEEGLEGVCGVFRGHEIDGRALLLLKSDTMMKHMNLKLGPSLKVCNLIEALKKRK